MDPSSSSAQSNPTEQESTQEQPRKRNPAFSKESLRSNLEEISKETEQISQVLPKQPENEDVRKQIQQLDQKQSVWLRLFIVWLIYNLSGFAELFIYILSEPEIPEELEEFAEEIRAAMYLGILIKFGLTLLMASPYLIQLWAIYKKSFKRTITSIRIMKVFIVIGVIFLALDCLILYKIDQLKEIVSSEAFKIPEEQMELFSIYVDKELMLSCMYDVAERLVYILLCLVGAIKYRNYLMQREYLMQKANKED